MDASEGTTSTPPDQRVTRSAALLVCDPRPFRRAARLPRGRAGHVPADARLHHDRLLREQRAAAASTTRARPRGRLEPQPVPCLTKRAESALAAEDLDARPEEVPDTAESGRVDEGPFEHSAGDENFLADLARDADVDRIAVEGTQLALDGVGLAANLDQERDDQGQELARFGLGI